MWHGKLARRVHKIARGGGEEHGASAIEYAILASFIAAIIVAIVLVLGQQTQSLFQCTSETLKNAGSTC